jgi:hypothetical protein
MPEYMISNGGSATQYARIDAKGVTFGPQASATLFGSPEAAKAAFKTACEALWSAALRKGKAALEKGTLVYDKESNRCILAADLERSHAHRYGPMHLTAEEHYATQWLAETMRRAQAGKSWDERVFGSVCHVASRASSDDLLGVQQLFYVANAQGWLSRPRTRYGQSTFEMNASFSNAIGFSSREAALSEIKKHRITGAWIAQAASVFTRVEPASANTKPFPTVSAIASACEARDIASAIEASSQERLSAMRGLSDSADPAPAPKKSASRL